MEGSIVSYRDDPRVNCRGHEGVLARRVVLGVVPERGEVLVSPNSDGRVFIIVPWIVKGDVTRGVLEKEEVDDSSYQKKEIDRWTARYGHVD